MTYSSSVSVNRHSYVRRGQNSISFRSRTKTLGPVSNTIVLILLACLIGLLCLTQVTKTNGYGYQINTLQRQQSQLESEKENLEVTAARLQSLDRIKSSQVAKSLVPTSPAGTIRN